MMTCASASMMTCMITTALHDDLWASLKLSLPFANTDTGSCRIVPQAKASRHCAACWSVSVMSLCRPGSGLQRSPKVHRVSKSTRHPTVSEVFTHL